MFLIFLSALPFRDSKLLAPNSYIPAVVSLLISNGLVTARPGCFAELERALKSV